MKLNALNSDFAIIKTSFLGGGVESFHLSLNSALRERSRLNLHSKYQLYDIVPIHHLAKFEMIEYNYTYYNKHNKHAFPPDEYIKLLCELPHKQNCKHWLELCL